MQERNEKVFLNELRARVEEQTTLTTYAGQRLQNLKERNRSLPPDTKETIEQMASDFQKIDLALSDSAWVVALLESGLDFETILKVWANNLPRAKARGIFFFTRFGSHSRFENRGFLVQNKDKRSGT